MASKLTRRELFDRVATYEAFGYSNTQIASALGLTDGLIVQIQSADDYRNILAEKTADQMERVTSLSNGWDAVEALALGQVMDTLQNAPDPDYALRAAALANKASRHGGRGNTPIMGGRATAVVRLGVAFVNAKLVAPENGQAAPVLSDEPPVVMFDGESQREVPSAEGKRTNMLDPASAEEILTGTNRDNRLNEEQMSIYAELDID